MSDKHIVLTDTNEIIKIRADRSCMDLPGFSKEITIMHFSDGNDGEIITVYVHDGFRLSLKKPNSTFLGVLYCNDGNDDESIELTLNEMRVSTRNTICFSSVGTLDLVNGIGVLVCVPNYIGLPMLTSVTENEGRECDDNDDETQYTTVIRPVVCGEPCINILYIPEYVTQDVTVNNFIVVVLVIKGSGLYNYNGKDHSFFEGDIIFIPKQIAYQLSALDSLVILAFIQTES